MTWAAGRGGNADAGNGLFMAPAPGREQGVRGLIGWLRLDGLTTARAEAVLPTIPALEMFIAAQAGGGARICGGFWGLLPSVSRALTHGCPQQ
jgi:hypothetical protein